MNRFVQSVSAAASLFLFAQASYSQLPTQFTGSFPTFTRLTAPRVPATDEYVITTSVSEPANTRAGVVGFDKYDFAAGSTTVKEFSEPREVTLAVSEGGRYNNDIWVFNHSTLNIDGGVITGTGRGVIGLDNSTFNLLRGAVRGVLAYGQSRIDLSPNTDVTHSAFIAGTSHVDARGAEIGGLFVFSDSATGNLSGGVYRTLSTSNSASVTAMGSFIDSDASAGGTSRLDLADTSVSGSLSASVASELFLSGGSVAGNVAVSDNATLSVTNASIGGNATATGGNLTLAGSTAGQLLIQGTANALVSDYQADQLSTSGQSTAYISNVTVSGTVQAENSSSLQLLEAEVGSLFVFHTAQVDFNGGQVFEDVVLSGGEARLTDLASIFGSVDVGEGATLTLSGSTEILGQISGTGGDIFLTGGATRSVTGAGDSFISIANVLVRGVASANDSSQVIMHSGFVDQDLRSVGESHALLTGGTIQRNLVAIGGGTINMFGGLVAGRAYVDAASTFNYFGGQISGDSFPNVPPGGGETDGIVEQALTELELGAGSGELSLLAGRIVATEGSTVNIYGTNLATQLVDANYVDPDTGASFSVYELIGQLADGTQIGGQLMFLQNGTGSTYNLLPPPVPEPSAVVLLVLAVRSVYGFRLKRG